MIKWTSLEYRLCTNCKRNVLHDVGKEIEESKATVVTSCLCCRKKTNYERGEAK